MKILIHLIIFFSSFLIMEGVAWFSHKYIMHGLLWFLHIDHHQSTKGKLQKNDLFFLFYAIPSILLIGIGAKYSIDWMLYSGLGIMAYGFVYFIFHEVFIHKRLNWFKNSSSKYLRAMRKAHLSHHKQNSKTEYSCFGMLVFPKKYYK